MGSISFDKDHFGEGASRRAYKAKVTKGTYAGYNKGTELVLKVIKASTCNEGVRLTNEDIRAQRLTARYADTFNSTMRPEKPIYVRVGTLHSSEKEHFDSRGNRTINKGENMLLEQFIHGHWQKFNSNTGWSCQSCQTPDAFSHWTWVHSNGQYLVCDLQGHRGRPGGPKWGPTGSRDYYLFTDPVVMSRTGEFGCTDLGSQGIQDWFARHTCNQYCRSLGVAGNKPRASQAQRRKRMQTSYR